ncbi:MAG: hypothetical protein HY066_17540 [Betaproteobacteria bacterium]|nr:hypothetical protein [Betaproteobacteria bacterium]
MSPDKNTTERHAPQRNPQGRSNLRVGLLLGAVALAIYAGSILQRYWL